MTPQPTRPNPGFVEPGDGIDLGGLRRAVSGPTVLFATGLLAFAAGLWSLAPWLALVIVGAGAMSAAVLAALPRKEA